MTDVTEQLAAYIEPGYSAPEPHPVVVEIAKDFAPKAHTLQLRVLTSPDCLQAMEFLSQEQLIDVTRHLIAYFSAKGMSERIFS